MQYFKLKFVDGTIKIVKGKNALEIVKRYDLCSRANVETRMFQLSGEQEAIAMANDQED
jgi:hypothetical protein